MRVDDKVHINTQSALPIASNNSTVIILRCLATWLTKRRWLNHQQKSNLTSNCMGKLVELLVMWNITGPSISCCKCDGKINQGLKFHNLALVRNLYVIDVEITPKKPKWSIQMENTNVKLRFPPTPPNSRFVIHEELRWMASFLNKPLYLKDLRTPWDICWHVLHVQWPGGQGWHQCTLITSFMSILRKTMNIQNIKITEKTTPQLKPRDNHEYVLSLISLPQFSAIPRSLFDSPEDKASRCDFWWTQ